MSYDGFKLFKVKVDRGVAFVTIDNPPMNLLNMQMIMEFGIRLGLIKLTLIQLRPGQERTEQYHQEVLAQWGNVMVL